MKFAAGFMTLVAISAVVTQLTGCNIVGPAMYIVEGPPSADAVHNLADVPTVVFIDDRRNVVSPISMRKAIADKVSEDLMVKKILSATISSQDAMALASQRERNSNIISIEEIGKAVGAKQVIYVEMVQFQDTPDGYTPRPTASCRVKVVDVDAQKRVYPPVDAEEPSRVVQAMIREVDPSVYSTRDGRLKVFDALAKETGSAVGKLFYKHEIRQLGGNLNPR